MKQVYIAGQEEVQAVTRSQLVGLKFAGQAGEDVGHENY